MSRNQIKNGKQRDAYSSPYSLGERIGIALWAIVWLVFFRPTPKFLSPWRVALLRLFGARIRGHVFVSESARIKIPWNLIMEDRACIGPFCDVYNLGIVRLRARSTASRYVALCAGGHDITTPLLPLTTGPIDIGPDVFIGSHAFVLQGVQIGAGAVVGAASVVVSDLPKWQICAGNPCKPIKPRKWKR